MNVDEGSITWVISDMNDVIIAKRKQLHSGGAIDAEVKHLERDTRKVQRQTVEMVETTQKKVDAKKRAEESFVSALEEFNASQERLIQSAEDNISKNCSNCNIVISNLRDKGSMKKTNVCFG